MTKLFDLIFQAIAPSKSKSLSAGDLKLSREEVESTIRKTECTILGKAQYSD
jgi:hypothetical protein